MVYSTTSLLLWSLLLASRASSDVASCSPNSSTSLVYSPNTLSTVRQILGILQRQIAGKQTLTIGLQSTRQQCDRPFICITYAQTIDGHIAINTSGPHTSFPREPKGTSDTSDKSYSSNLILSSPDSFLLTHALRSIFDAVLIGGNTLETDNPRLNNRLWDDASYNWNESSSMKEQQQQQHEQQQDEEADTEEEEKVNDLPQPIPVVLDSQLSHVLNLIRRNNNNHQMMACAKCHPMVILCCNHQAYDQDQTEIQNYCILHNICIKLQPCKCYPNTTRLDLEDVVKQLRTQHGIQSIMVEGGSSILSSFLSKYRDMVDSICITICPRFVGKHGLNALGSLDVQASMAHETDGYNMMEFPNSRWYTLGSDCIYLASSSHDALQ